MSEPPVKRSGISREEFDRIIRRASELQAEDAGPRGSAESFDEAELLRIGGEVGIEIRHLRRALGEVRAEALQPDAPRDSGVLARLIGEGFLRASRVVPGAAGEVDARLAAHLEAAESLRRVRKRGERSLWEPAGGLVAVARRALRVGGSTFDLARAGSLELSVVAIEDARSLVTIIADLRRMRGGMGVGAMVGLGLTAGAVTLGAGLVLGAPILALPGGVLGIGAGSAMGRRQFSNEARRIRLAMEGLLDRLEAGEPLVTSRERPWNRRLGH